MFLSSLLAALLSAAPLTQSAPVDYPQIPADPYNCGYVRPHWNVSVVAGVFAYDSCSAFFFNETLGGWQDAFAYALYGGCICRFYTFTEDCLGNVKVPDYQGPTDRSRESLFPGSRPSWYRCRRTEG
ncbi:hypothetical protein C7974DRAFT_320494 [Boeremia exigua]|uniref:uncharacterized protein n=1 Tax=Boeremia exigua TaxID=749465 RepID=UPI001E8DCCA6|nr:uncharacterized protein C7974DRAFT_320494 [Boeremia exigua]KAH6614816.1 hypothetical protein C7974DRAFT_320494 [Boeremia exigua]